MSEYHGDCVCEMCQRYKFILQDHAKLKDGLITEKFECNKALKEVERLKAELELKEKERCANVDYGIAVTNDRDAWKARAEKLAEALRKMISPETDWENGAIGVGNTFRYIAREALADYAKATEGIARISDRAEGEKENSQTSPSS